MVHLPLLNYPPLTFLGASASYITLSLLSLTWFYLLTLSCVFAGALWQCGSRPSNSRVRHCTKCRRSTVSTSQSRCDTTWPSGLRASPGMQYFRSFWCQGWQWVVRARRQNVRIFIYGTSAVAHKAQSWTTFSRPPFKYPINPCLQHSIQITPH